MTVDHGLTVLSRLIDTAAVGLLFPLLYPLAVVFHRQDRRTQR